MNAQPHSTVTSPAPLFSIVVLSWNSLGYLKDCIASVGRQTNRSFELICVDNGSSDGSREWLASTDLGPLVNAPVRKVLLGVNTGFAAGMNIGMRMSQGTWVIPLNVDIVLADDFLEQAARVIEQHPGYGSIGPLVYKWDNGPTDTVDTTGIWLTPHLSATTDVTATAGGDAFGPAGCCPLFHRDALVRTQIGPRAAGAEHRFFYDELYFAYGEDVDLFLRLQLRGFRCLFSPAVKAWHAHSATQAGVAWHQKDYQTLMRVPANAFFTLVKDFPLGMLVVRIPRLLAMPVVMSLLLLFRAPHKAWCPLVAYVRICRHLVRTVALRWSIQRRRSVSSRAIKGFFR